MNDQAPETLRFRRVLVTLDASAGNSNALDIAVRLAASAGAELEGVFIEDMNLMRLASLPFLREVRACSLVEQAISPESMRRDLRALARQAEQRLQNAATAMGVSSTFRVWRGQPGVAALCASFQADIFSLTSVGPVSPYRAATLPSLRNAAAIPDSILVLYRASPQADRALAAASLLAEHLGVGLEVAVTADAEGAAALERTAREIAGRRALKWLRILRTDADLPGWLTSDLRRSRNRVLVAEAEHPLLLEPAACHALEALSGPVLFVR